MWLIPSNSTVPDCTLWPDTPLTLAVLVFLPIGLHSRNWLSSAIALIPTKAALLYRIQVEEAALLRPFGEEYIACSKATQRLITGIY